MLCSSKTFGKVVSCDNSEGRYTLNGFVALGKKFGTQQALVAIGCSSTRKRRAQSELNQTEKDKYCMISLTCVIHKPTNKTRIHGSREQMGSFQRHGGGEWVKWVKGVKRYKLPVIK